MTNSSDTDNSSVHAMLCNTWYGDGLEGDVFLLNADGTGEIISSSEMILCLGRPLRWRIVGLHDPPTAPPPSLIDWILARTRPEPVLSATIEMQIVRERPQLTLYSRRATDACPENLVDSAFVPREFRVTIVRGAFVAWWSSRLRSPCPNTLCR
ncbi:hypothetical protein HYPSUDRAFT_71420 [Hypholoma sublateritium FD-334 SS-4]|uniref:Uncharacterized protein n=1 Tax=Hypholoma sublateritium (strain FD-334 SS-4) TaxID=945553 RepID=A0A0D2NI95_HYPSF|nr:hypothetical protein HYPSUDRAFT_71420 [Hypholoma sublateritium FD-334 SS-4]